MKIQISYSDSVYREAQRWNERCARLFGKFDKIISYGEQDLDAEFKEKNRHILGQKRGGGYWLWKPYVIDKTLQDMQDGDYLFYCDSGAVFLKPVDILIKVMERDHQDIMLFEVYDHLEKYWTKRDIFQYIDFDNETCANSNQYMATFILIKKTENSVKFIQEYLRICQYKELITDAPNTMGVENYIGYDENRHDGSILSILAKKNGIQAYKDPSQWGIYQKIMYKRKRMITEKDYEVYERSPYSLVLYLHRYKKITLKNIICSLRDTVKIYFRVLKDENTKF